MLSYAEGPLALVFFCDHVWRPSLPPCVTVPRVRAVVMTRDAIKSLMDLFAKLLSCVPRPMLACLHIG
jgi:hypothetical protein